MVGQTKDAGWQIGVSRTLPYPPEAVWAAIMSPEGVARWLGAGAKLVKGERYETADGTVGEVRSLHEVDRVRLTWQPRDWDHETTVQVAVSASGAKTRLVFHQERMTGPDERARQREHWRAVIGELTGLLDA